LTNLAFCFGEAQESSKIERLLNNVIWTAQPLEGRCAKLQR